MPNNNTLDFWRREIEHATDIIIDMINEGVSKQKLQQLRHDWDDIRKDIDADLQRYRVTSTDPQVDIILRSWEKVSQAVDKYQRDNFDTVDDYDRAMSIL